MSQTIDPVELAAQLIRCPSVTPAEAGALDLLQETLSGLGFSCTRLPFEEDGTAPVDNLYARLGSEGPHICFAGHTDVVPVGDIDDWQDDPFAGEIRAQALWGRGAADMKGSIAAFAAAVAAYRATHENMTGSISFLITGDEEGPSINGTRKMLGWLEAQGEIIDDCLVGEPTNPDVLGDMIKIGRRGSVNGVVRVIGTQGHVAYPHLADNPVPQLAALMVALSNAPLDDGTEHFQPSNLEVTNFDVGNPTTNVIPAEATARFNIRYNDTWQAASLNDWIKTQLDAAQGAAGYELELSHTGDCFLTEPNAFVEQLSGAVSAVTGREPELSTSGGTSDARFIKDVTRVVEFGLVGETMHKVDERVPVEDIRKLSAIYETLLSSYFSS